MIMKDTVFREGELSICAVSESEVFIKPLDVDHVPRSGEGELFVRHVNQNFSRSLALTNECPFNFLK